MGGARPRTRSPEILPRLREVTLAQSRPLAAAPASLRGGGRGNLGPSAFPSFPAVGALPVVFSCNCPSYPTSEALTRSLPSSGCLAAASGASPVRTLRPLARPASAAVRRPQSCLPQGSGECLLPLSSVHPRLFSPSPLPRLFGTLPFPLAPCFQPCPLGPSAF